jgi:hypothetical protein
MSRRRTTSQADSLPFDTLTLEGGLFVPELLEKAARGDAAQQTEDDYGVPKGLKLQEEYGRAYRISSALWQGFAAQLVRKDLPAHEATGAFILALLRDALGYPDLALVDAPLQPTAGSDRLFPISALALGGRVPIVIAPHDLGLDDPDPHFAIRGGGTRRKSPFQLTQEYLNAAPNSLWGLCTNGRAIRLVRDADTLTRPAYLEFDLATILREGEDRYADFAALWRLLHGSRAGAVKSLPADCAWEKWKTEGHSLGLRVRDGLRKGVTEALLILGNGFLAHRDNTALRERLGGGSLSKDAYFQQLLRLVYRCLFLFCAEERTDPSSGIPLLHSLDSSPVARDHYARGYSLRRLRTRCLRRAARDSHGDLWQSVSLVFRTLATGEPRLALPALGGLFAPDQCPDLDAAALANADLLAAMRQLRWSSQSGRLTSIDYRNMGPEELGSVYESLLELIPSVEIATRRFGFVGITDSDSTAGNARKLTGSYYTPDSLVQELIKSALDPVIARKVADHPEDPTAAILSLSVIDPACGSGHFLISAARRLAEKLAELRAPDGAVRPGDYRHALREVISHCIYGVDRNPMALELARTALWLEGYEPGQPLSFLDHHLQCGDALLGLTSFDQLRKGIAKDAFTVLSGDDKTVCKNLAAINRDSLKSLEKRLKDKSAELFDAGDLDDALQRLEGIEAMPDDSTAEVEAKKSAYTRFLDEARTSRLAHACDLLVAAYLTPKTPDTASLCPTTATLLDVLFPQQGKAAPQAVIDHAGTRCREARVFHWPLRFAHIFGHGGFDCVLGNPPWERIKLQEEEFFASREPLVAAARNKAERAKRIQWLSEGSLHYHLSQFTSAPPPDRGEVALYREFVNEKRLAEATSAFAHVNGEDGGRFPLTGVGDVNTYALFAETMSEITAKAGRCGFIVPMGIATDDTTKDFFAYQVANRRLAQMIGMWEIRAWFPATDDRKSFCLLTLGLVERSRFIFDVRSLNDLITHQKWIELPPEDLLLINPNTRTCPVFRSQADANLTKLIYQRVPVLIRERVDEEEEQNSWKVTLSSMFHMSNDSSLFLDAPDVATVPLYEAKMLHQFDHRWADFSTQKRNRNGELVPEDLAANVKQDHEMTVMPRYWVPERSVLAKIALAPKCVRDAYRDQDARSLLVAIAIWIEARHQPDLLDGMSSTTARQRVIQLGGVKFESLPTEEKDWLRERDLVDARECEPLGDQDIILICTSSDLSDVTRQLLDRRSPKWLIGWRRNARNDDERSLLSTVIPRAGVGDSIFLVTSELVPRLNAALAANLNTLVLDFVMRQKLAGSNLSFYYIKQLPILPPTAYSDKDLAFIVPRVLELTYTADDLSGWARDLGHDGPPFRFDPDRRAMLRAELDAWYARLYGLTREELQYILDPATTHGPDYPTVTFPGLKKNEIAKYGEYRTQRLVLEAWDRLNG